jgi:acyl-CoA reductase-like NAD-dependent aldehyde dehydrogenase
MFEYDLETLSGKRIGLEIEDRMYVDGEFVSASETFEAEHPPTHEVLTEVPIAGPEAIDDAVRAAQRASEQWREVDVFERREILEEFADYLEANEEALTNLDVADNGSSISRMKFDVEKGARNIRYMAGISHELKGEAPPTESGTHDFTLREPYGVAAGIVPFNHPHSRRVTGSLSSPRSTRRCRRCTSAAWSTSSGGSRRG